MIMTDIVVATFITLLTLMILQRFVIRCSRSLLRLILWNSFVGNEGVNGTLAGSQKSINTSIAALKSLPNLAQLEYKESPAKSMPFHRLKVRLKREIVTMGVPGVDPLERVGTYVTPSDWNKLIADPETYLIDTRNSFEVELGNLKGP